jgi:hypothetical protein
MTAANAAQKESTPPEISPDMLERAIEIERAARAEVDARERDQKRAKAGLLTRETAGRYVPSGKEPAYINMEFTHQDCECTDRVPFREMWIDGKSLCFEFRPGDQLPGPIWQLLRPATKEEAKALPSVQEVLRARALHTTTGQRALPVAETKAAIEGLERSVEETKVKIATLREALPKFRADAAASREEEKAYLASLPPGFDEKISQVPPFSDKRPLPRAIPDYANDPKPRGSSELVNLGGGAFVLRPADPAQRQR